MSFLKLSFTTLSLLAFSVLQVAQAAPAPLVVHPGTAADVVITTNNTLNATAPAAAPAPVSVQSTVLNLALVNYLNSSNVKAYVTGLNANNQLVFLNSAGDFYYPTTTSAVPVPLADLDVSIPLGAQGSTTYANIPGYLSSGRVWFADGPLHFYVVGTPNGPGLVEPAAVNPNDPNAATNYGFGELTWYNGGIFADISFVDFVGTPIGIELTTTDGTPEQKALGLPSDAVQSVCSDLQAQSKIDGQPWEAECVYTTSGELIRVLAPGNAMSQNNTWEGYFDSYIREVFEAFSTTPLIVNTQAAAANVSCYADTTAQTLSCEGDNRAYPAPSASDIFGCNSGPFGFQAGDNGVHYAVVPRLCAAFNRGEFMTAGGSFTPFLSPEVYYTSNPTVYNWYSKVVHSYEWENKGYAFSYDDVSPSDAQNVAGVVSSGAPELLTFMVGGFDLA